MSSVKTLEELIILRRKFKEENKKVVFTNGVFDLIHGGHVDYLLKAKLLGDVLFVGINSDASVKRIKGDKRPVLLENERAFVISNLKPVDFVTIFGEDTPAQLIEYLIPDVLVKGADWSLDKIIGREVVESNGGVVKAIEFVNDSSTSKIIQKILQKYSN